MENLVDKYYKQVLESNSPSNKLLEFFCELYNKQINRTDLNLFKELVKLFGRERVFFGIVRLNLYYSYVRDGKAIGRLLRNIIAKNAEKKEETLRIYSPDLTEQVTEAIQKRNSLEPLEELSISKLSEDEHARE